MSGYYYRVTPEPEKAKVYGFEKVTQTELNDIVSRLTKPTYNNRVSSDEAIKAHNYRYVHSAPPPRTPTYCHRRVSTGSQAGQLRGNKKFSEHELQRLLRRIQKPTRAHQLSRRDYEPSEGNFVRSRPTTASRPNTASERKKAFYQLSRPTTASRGKHATECHLCDEDDREVNKMLVPFEYPYAETKVVFPDEEANIVFRVSSPTKASRRGNSVCYKTEPDYEILHKQSENLPLVSGLPRSKTVSQIVNRLHYNVDSKRRRNFHGYAVQATPTTDFTAAAS